MIAVSARMPGKAMITVRAAGRGWESAVAQSGRACRNGAAGQAGRGEGWAMQVHDSLIELVGNTPLVRLHAGHP